MYQLFFLALVVTQPPPARVSVPEFSVTSGDSSLRHLNLLKRLFFSVQSAAAKTKNAVGEADRKEAIANAYKAYEGIQISWPMKVQSVNEKSINVYLPMYEGLYAKPKETDDIKVIQVSGQTASMSLPHLDDFTKKLRLNDVVTVRATIVAASQDGFILDSIVAEKYQAPRK